MIEARISGRYNDALFTIFDPHTMQKLATEEFIIEKVYEYLISFNYNCRKLKTYRELYYIFLRCYNIVQSL